MNLIHMIVFSACVFFFSFILTRFLIQFAKKKNIIDVPNDRSSHDKPTPRGGGLSISLSILIYLIVIIIIKEGLTTQNYSLLGIGAVIISIIGILDDVKNLSATIRAFLYLSTSSIFILLITKFTYISFQEIVFISVAILGITGLTNLYNFMDGADGIAGIQAIIAALPAGILFYVLNEYEFALLCFTLVASTTGFLIWNWPPARIFMGDVGSCALGFIFGGLIFITYLQKSISINIWLVLLSFFIVDATLTLIKRVINRERWYQAHRSHAFQRYLQMGHSHTQLAITVSLFSVLILWPATFLAYKIPEFQLHITIIIYLFLSFIWYFIQQKYKQSHLNG
ncbi:MAG: glycosyltransferase family 4 protein [Proteobacteria bacterium]|nr:glycosyltransferase family 4 protein [Pseudomonadota bacterium]